LEAQKAKDLKIVGPFVNRALQDWYQIEESDFGKKVKGSTIDFLFSHPNPIVKASGEKWDDDDQLVWGEQLKQNLKAAFTQSRTLRFEVFNDWLPTDDCFVSLDKHVTDKYGQPVAKVRIGYHHQDLQVGEYLTEKAEKLLEAMGAKNIYSSVSPAPPTNLVAGGCRFGNDAQTSVLNKNCRAHEVDNLYVTDGSFMPTGGSVPYTYTIYANSFRVGEKIKQHWLQLS
jgi:choline dehydrogenase-like flavoprotein